MGYAGEMNRVWIPLFLLFLFGGVKPAAAEGWHFVVRGECQIRLEPPKSDGSVWARVTDSVTGSPVANLDVVVSHSGNVQTLQTDAKGQVAVTGGGFMRFRHPGSELYAPCGAFSYVPDLAPSPVRFAWHVLLLAISVVFIGIALFPYAKSRWRRFLNPPRPETSEEAQEVELLPASRTFVPWRKPGMDGQVLDFSSSLPLGGVEITADLKEGQVHLVSDENGRFHLPSGTTRVSLRDEDRHPVSVPVVPRGQLVVRLMTRPVRALWLLRQICKKHDPERAARLTPRQAINARIPPEEVIERLEKLAYAGETPAPEELARLEERLLDTEPRDS